MKIKKLNPIMTYVLLIVGVVILSGILSFFNVGASYSEINAFSNTYDNVWVSVESLFSLSGLKYIFTSTVSNFVAFTPLSMLLIVLIGFGIMEQSGFLKTFFNLLTRRMKKGTVTFIFVLACILLSIIGDLGYVIMIPLGAVLFLYGRRNPQIGVVTAFAALTCGTGLSLFLTSIDSSLNTLTTNASHILDTTYTINFFAYILLMAVAIIVLSVVITLVTERITSKKLANYEFKDEKKEFKLTRREVRGLIFALGAGFIYLLIFIYNIIPGLPASGNLLDYSQTLYIDKLFSTDSFFSQGFVFIVTMWFIVLGLFYGIGSKSIKDHHDFCYFLSSGLDNIGYPVLLILLASILINVFKKTNMGTVLTALLVNLINGSGFTGFPLILLSFICVILSTLLLPNSVSKYSIMAGTIVPIFMNAGYTPEFTQVIFRFAESVSYGITPLMAYFVIYLAYMDRYEQSEESITLFGSIRYILKYSLFTCIILLGLIIIWSVVGLPLGAGAMTAL